jgi:hypothetical protein
MAWEPPRRSPAIAWSRLSDDDLEFLEQLAIRAKALEHGQDFVATLSVDEWVQLERIALKAGLDALI